MPRKANVTNAAKIDYHFNITSSGVLICKSLDFECQPVQCDEDREEHEHGTKHLRSIKKTKIMPTWLNKQDNIVYRETGHFMRCLYFIAEY